MDKLPLKSKKFLAYMIGEAGWKVCIFYTLWNYQSKIDFHALTLLVTLVIISGFLQVGYILGQAALDKYVQVAKSMLDDEKKQQDRNDNE